MKFEDWWNTENKIELSIMPDDYSKAKYVYEAVYNSMKNCLNCGKRRHCFLWHQAKVRRNKMKTKDYLFISDGGGKVIKKWLKLI